MFTVFISKSFSDSLLSENNRNLQHYNTFVSDFFQKLNIDYVISDFDLAGSENPLYQFIFRHLYNYEPAQTFKLPKPIEYYLSEGISELKSLPFYEDIEHYLFEKSLFFVNLPSEITNNIPNISALNLVNASQLDLTFNNFLINGKLNCSISQEEFKKGNISFNPWDCPKCNAIFIDDQYLVKRPTTGKLAEFQLTKRLIAILERFVSTNSIYTKTIAIALPNKCGYGNEPWSDEEKILISNSIHKVISRLCKNTKCEIVFHNLSSHPRRTLTNYHFFSLSDGFDFQLKNDNSVKERVDDIRFDSVFLLSNSGVIKEYIGNRLKKTSAKKHFPY